MSLCYNVAVKQRYHQKRVVGGYYVLEAHLMAI